jgi:transposase
VHWLLRQRRADLNADERRMLNRLFRYSPKLQEAYEACESLTAIYESRLSKGQGKRKLRGWMEGRVHQARPRLAVSLDSVLGTLNTHFEEVPN